MSKLCAGFQSYGEDLVTVSKSSTVAIKALDFDGSNDYVRIPNDASLNINNNLSVVCLVKQVTAATDKAIAGMYFAAGNQRAWLIQTGSSNSRAIKVIVSDDGTYAGHNKTYETTNPVLTAGAWNQVGFTFASGTLKIFVNGAEVVAVTNVVDDAITSVHSCTQIMAIAARSDLSAYINAQICDVSMWKTNVLTAADFASLWGAGTPIDPTTFTPAGGAVLESSWLWNETITHPTVPDNTGSNDGTMTNMVAGDIIASGFTSPLVTTGTFSITDAFYKDDEAFRAALETAVQVTFASIDIFKPSTTESRWLIEDSGAATFSLTWDSDNARTYMGFTDDLTGADSYYSDGAVGSTWYPISGCMSPVFARVADRRVSTDHTGWSRAAVVGRHDELKVTTWIEQSEAANAFAVIQRFIRGARGVYRLDGTNSTTWAWSAAGWDGEMIVALKTPAGKTGFSNYLSRPWIGVKEITLDFIRWV